MSSSRTIYYLPFRDSVQVLASYVVALALFFFLAVPQASAQADLQFWNEGTAKERIIRFVESVTHEGSPDYLPPEQRVAVFDNDGTLWAEKPVPFEFMFALDEVKRIIKANPTLKEKEPFKSIADNDLQNLASMGKTAVAQIMALTHADMTTDEFSQRVENWINSAKHPKRGVRYTDLVYQPQLELLDFLRKNGFKTYIVSGGGIEFMRVFAEKIYGIPPERVIGSSGKVEYRLDEKGKPYLFKQAEMEFVDDGPGKPVAINHFIGRQPVIAVGNSDGDLQMLQYTMGGSAPHLAIYIHHDDAEREYSYDRTDKLAKLDRGLDQAAADDWLVVSIKRDWMSVFSQAER